MAHRLLILGCRTMRDGVVVSAIFFVAALLLFMAVRYVLPDLAYLQHIVLCSALVLIILAPIVRFSCR